MPHTALFPRFKWCMCGKRDNRRLKGYIHKGIVKTDGFVDLSQSITDPSKMKVSPIDDSFRISYLEKGNFEWWYFDVIDSNTGCALKLVAH